MNKLGEILTIVLVSSSVFVLLDTAKRNLHPETTVPVVNCAPAQEPLPAEAPAPQSAWTKADRSGLRDALRDEAADTAENDADITYVDGSGTGNALVSDRAAYLADTGDAQDIVVSSVFKSRAAATRAMESAGNSLKSGGKSVLFTSLMRESSGGFFYVIRLEPSAAVTNAAPVAYDGEQLYVNSVKGAVAMLENDCRRVLRDGGDR